MAGATHFSSQVIGTLHGALLALSFLGLIRAGNPEHRFDSKSDHKEVTNYGLEYAKLWETDVQGSNCSGGAGSRVVGDLRC